MGLDMLIWVDKPNRVGFINELCVILVDIKTTDENNKNFNYYGWTFKLVDWLQ